MSLDELQTGQVDVMATLEELRELRTKIEPVRRTLASLDGYLQWEIEKVAKETEQAQKFIDLGLISKEEQHRLINQGATYSSEQTKRVLGDVIARLLDILNPIPKVTVNVVVVEKEKNRADEVGHTPAPLPEPEGPRTPIDYLDLTTKAYNTLKRGGIEYIEQLEPLTDEELDGVKNIGPGIVKEVRDKLTGYHTKHPL
ncbi:MAG: DNA-directed RNA polymerase subunit alpha C-terminal domain-containing protein [bacterium]|nr:DNA-directed RNA polymerase subunit alpha C-terminal domain-containing protein [bacterium]